MRYLYLIRLLLLVICLNNVAFSRVLAYESFAGAGDSSPQDIMIADFESDSYDSWQVSGTAFGPAPAEGTLANQMDVTGFEGDRLANSFYGGDVSKGTLLSPAFKIERPFINFLIGGGGYDSLTCMNLLVNGEVVRTAVGPNTMPGGSEQLYFRAWDVKELVGKNATIEIVDNYSDGWGHICVDSISQGYKSKQTVFLDKQRVLTADKKYLNIPVKHGAANRLMRLYVDGSCQREFTVELSGDTPDYWVYLELTEFEGKDVTVQLDRCLPENTDGFDAIFQGDTYPGSDQTYSEALRPQVHFSSIRGWINDTNGMVYYKGEYHMFYQHNPYGWNWGNMTWGHAVSNDMLHWTEIGDAIHPDELGTIFSGSAVIDENNDAGFQTGVEKAMVCFYTSAGGNGPLSAGEPFTQSIAYSNDRGRTWTKYEGNPVINHIAGGNRDPKVIWHEPTGKWVMVLFIDNGLLEFFTSTDLKSWTKTCELNGFHECPELFELPVDNDPSNKKWVVYGANGDYMIGSFDGVVFTPETSKIRFHYGNCFYASQTFNNMPESDGRRVQMTWGQVEMPGMPFNQMILFPVTLTLHSTASGIRMFVNPVDEIESLYSRDWSWHNEVASAGSNILSSVDGSLYRIKAVLKPEGAQACRLKIGSQTLEYNVAEAKLSCAGQTASMPLVNGELSLDVIVDRMTIEIYANDGEIYMPVRANLAGSVVELGLDSVGGNTRIIDMNIYELNSVWNK